MASLCKGSSFAEYGAGLQHTNKQQHMVLQKKVAFAEKQAEQVSKVCSMKKTNVLEVSGCFAALFALCTCVAERKQRMFLIECFS